jgi:hypothetical protein
MSSPPVKNNIPNNKSKKNTPTKKKSINNTSKGQNVTTKESNKDAIDKLTEDIEKYKVQLSNIESNDVNQIKELLDYITSPYMGVGITYSTTPVHDIVNKNKIEFVNVKLNTNTNNLNSGKKILKTYANMLKPIIDYMNIDIKKYKLYNNDIGTIKTAIDKYSEKDRLIETFKNNFSIIDKILNELPKKIKELTEAEQLKVDFGLAISITEEEAERKKKEEEEKQQHEQRQLEFGLAILLEEDRKRKEEEEDRKRKEEEAEVTKQEEERKIKEEKEKQEHEQREIEFGLTILLEEDRKRKEEEEEERRKVQEKELEREQDDTAIDFGLAILIDEEEIKLFSLELITENTIQYKEEPIKVKDLKNPIKIDPNTFLPIIVKSNKNPSKQKNKKEEKNLQKKPQPPQFDPINYYFEIKQKNNTIESITAYLKPEKTQTHLSE